MSNYRTHYKKGLVKCQPCQLPNPIFVRYITVLDEVTNEWLVLQLSEESYQKLQKYLDAINYSGPLTMHNL